MNRDSFNWNEKYPSLKGWIDLFHTDDEGDEESLKIVFHYFSTAAFGQLGTQKYKICFSVSRALIFVPP